MKFLPGQSGNPAGRPPGALNKKTLALEAAYEARAEAAVNDIMERAKSGEPAAMRLCMERAVPTGRHRRIAFALPRIRTPEDAEAAIDVVMDGLADGVLSLADVADLLRIVERLLAMAQSIQETIRVREFIARRPSAEPVDSAEPDEADVQKALEGLHAAARRLEAMRQPEQDDAEGDALYFPVNPQPDGPAEAAKAPSRLSREANGSPGGAPPTPDRHIVPETVPA
jgi:hypothetical protein